MEYVLLVFKASTWDIEPPSSPSTGGCLATHHDDLPMRREERASGQGGAVDGLVVGEISLVLPLAWFCIGGRLGRYVPCACVRPEPGKGERFCRPGSHARGTARRHRRHSGSPQRRPGGFFVHR